MEKGNGIETVWKNLTIFDRLMAMNKAGIEGTERFFGESLHIKKAAQTKDFQKLNQQVRYFLEHPRESEK